VELFRILIHQLHRNWVWIKWVAAVLILVWLFHLNQESLQQIDWRKLHWGYLIAGALLCGIAFLITFVRWYFLVVSLELPFRMRDAVRLGFIGILFNYVAPGAAGGDIVKALLIAKEHSERKMVAAATVLLDRLLGLIALFCVGSIVSLLFFPLPDHGWLRLMVSLLWTGTAGGLIGLFLLLHTPLPRSRFVAWLFRIPWIGPVLEQIQSGILLYQQQTKVLWGAVGLSVIGHVCFLTVFYFASQSLHADSAAPSYLGHLLLIPAAELLGVVIPTPGGIGALEGAVQGVFVIANQISATPVDNQLAAAAGFSTALIFRAVNMLTALVGAVYYFFSRQEIEEVLEEEEHVLDEEEAAVGK
jgi:uncharacterized membrane protein YbhN (UPF0104 family)